MLEATLATMGWVVSNFLNAGVEPKPIGNENFTAAPSGTFRTADGLLNIAANETKQYEALCDLIGRPDLKTDSRFADRHSRKLHRDALNEEIEKALTARSALEWEPLMIGASVPVGRVLSVPEILSHPHIAARRFVKSFEASGVNQRVTRSGFQLSGDEPVPAGPAPEFSAHTHQWLSNLGYNAEHIERLHERGVI